MVLDALRAYFQLASGVTEESRQRAVAAARSVLAQTPSVDAGPTGQLHQQVAALAEDLMVTSRANRELLLGLIRTEVERALSRLGIASADEVDALRRSVERLERLVREQRSPTAAAAADSAPGTAAARTAATGTAATSTVEPASKAGSRKRATPKTAAATTSTATKAGSVTKAAGPTVVSGTERPRARRASRPTDEASPSRRARQGPAAAASSTTTSPNTSSTKAAAQAHQTAPATTGAEAKRATEKTPSAAATPEDIT
jgi:hypothetical protein